jgi:phage-related minor tail protein
MFKLLMMALLMSVIPMSVSAATEDVDTIKQMKISKSDILASMEQLRKGGQISEADYQKAKKELEAMNDSQIDGIKNKAVGIIEKNPEVINL